MTFERQKEKRKPINGYTKKKWRYRAMDRKSDTEQKDIQKTCSC